MRLSYLLKSLRSFQVYGSQKISIRSIVDDSRKVKKGYLFVAVKGANYNGHEFVDQAIKGGVVAIVGMLKPKTEWLKRVTYVRVDNSRKALSYLASAWYDHPSSKLKIIGVTGTDGKTTTASLIDHLLLQAGKKVGLISTIGAKIGKKKFNTGLHVTNPEPLVLQRIFSEMVRQMCEYAVVEVTSHGLDQERVTGVNFDTGVLTNITHEHLDYHKTFESYQKAKSKLFESVNYAVLNADDNCFLSISQGMNANSKITSYGLAEGKGVDILARNIKFSEGGMSFDVCLWDKTFQIKTKLLGDYNVSNILASMAAALGYGISIESIQKAIKTFKALPGRLERVKSKAGLEVFVDFAHTPNSLEKVLTLLRRRLDFQSKKGKLIAIFGCAGERDVAKRPLMGEISSRIADISIFTSEDPRHEDVSRIISEIVKGAKKTKAKEIMFKDYDGSNHRRGKKHVFVRIPERGEAIAFVINKIAQKGDTIVICGKGHERSMAYDSVEHPWSDHQAIETMNLDKNLTAVVLAAGRGIRMKSDRQKVINEIAGKPMLSYTLSTLRRTGFGRIIIVVGFQKDTVKDYFGNGCDYVFQPRSLGTGDALAKALKVIPTNRQSLVVLNGDDSAFYRPETLSRIIELHKKEKSTVTFTSLKISDPTGLGRVVRDRSYKFLRIVEEKEAKKEEKKIKEVNCGLYVFDISWLKGNVSRIEKSASGEYYIVDLVKIAVGQGKKVCVFNLKDQDQWMGVNTPEQLAYADKKMRRILTQTVI
ncbi:hypothetical protein A2686_03075 [Candidatus Woesebacteria bacterium RIFCSPHIGHO2_01_FULL_38_10]|uniref:UDP-N-acetylmuramyl-tripeptide synthetase n=1 Tax=Candidatus Woesebacteria bacterium RIFCSPLOWO2_01_FULL_39_10b TaxID=1802517 RepID=A0A1F8B5X2_9BACT|nr:MAG: hypothetical protein A2686_03075 [Candidatus Woesebacteria bacterium RIFCSPHIGHO2_01_FULL_38_10]OGM59310.1 MAG: hypothetical protein A2892_05620 [Candidatus Woesebacteria bacterium RIFCSPLOWO2_01_FULL_39_10b]